MGHGPDLNLGGDFSGGGGSGGRVGNGIPEECDGLDNDANGIITVTTSDDNAFKNASPAINSKKLTLAPLDSAGSVMKASTVGTTQVFQWRCGSTTDKTDAELQKFLPGSCRG